MARLIAEIKAARSDAWCEAATMAAAAEECEAGKESGLATVDFLTAKFRALEFLRREKV